MYEILAGNYAYIAYHVLLALVFAGVGYFLTNRTNTVITILLSLAILYMGLELSFYFVNDYKYEGVNTKIKRQYRNDIKQAINSQCAGRYTIMYKVPPLFIRGYKVKNYTNVDKLHKKITNLYRGCIITQLQYGSTLLTIKRNNKRLNRRIKIVTINMAALPDSIRYPN